MTGRLEGKVALITGGTSGIGAGTVQRLAAEGAKVVFTGSNAEAAAAISAGTGATFISQKVQDAASWGPLTDRIRSDFGRLDIAFANAGSEKGDGSIEAITLEGWNQVMDIMLTGAMLTVKAAVSLMKDNPGGASGSIIVNSSMNAHSAMGNFLAYSVSKAAVCALAKSVAMHCGNQGHKIRCNAILPGVVETAMITNLIEHSADPAAMRAGYEGMAPMKRMASVAEVAGLVAYLASDEAAFISGAEYLIDGATTAGSMGL